MNGSTKASGSTLENGVALSDNGDASGSVQLLGHGSDNAPRTDTFHSWLVCLAAFGVAGVSFAIHNNFGLIYSRLVSTSGHNNSSARAAWIGSLGMGINFAFSPFGSALTERFGFRKITFLGIFLSVTGLIASSFARNQNWLFVTYGLLWGCGSSLMYIPSLMALRAYFNKHLPLANGIAASGSGIGTVIFSFILRAMLDRFGLDWTFRFLAACILSLLLTLPVLATPVWFKMTHSKEQESHWCSKMFTLDIWRVPSFVIMAAAVPIFLFGYFIPFVYLYRLAVTLGIAEADAAWLIPCMSITSTIGKIGFGVMLSCCRVKPATLFQMAMFCMACCQFIVPFAKAYWMLCVYVALFGLFEGCFVGQLPVVVSNFVGFKLTGNALGVLFLLMAIMTMAGPPVAGAIYDSTLSYDISFYTAGGTSMIGAIVMLITLLPHFQKSNLINEIGLVDVVDTKDAVDGNLMAPDTRSLHKEFLRTSRTCLSAASVGQIRVIEKLTVL